MVEDRLRAGTFYREPQSLPALIAAFLDPTIAVVTYVAVSGLLDEPILRPELTLCLLVFALMFPGRNRFRDDLLGAGIDIVASWLVLLGILVLCGYATESLHLFETDVLLASALVTPLLQWTAVWIGRHVLHRHDVRRRHGAVVVGAGPLGAKVASAVGRDLDEGVEVIGFFDDRTDERLHVEGLAKRLGGLSDVARYVSAHAIRCVYLTLPLGSQPRMLELRESLLGTTASLYVVPDVYGTSIIQGRLKDVGGVAMVGIVETPFTGVNALVKRASDIALSLIVLSVAWPLMIFIAVGVKFSSPGPVISRRRCTGLDGDEITVHEFRTTITRRDGDTVAQGARDDSRLTRFGALLRRTSLDALPQLFDVLQGRMSVVGPYLHPVAVNDSYRRLIKAYMLRHMMRPGITGWAQVNGFAGEVRTLEQMQARVEYDLEYLRNWSLGLDLQIIARAIRLFLFDRPRPARSDAVD